MKKMKILVIEDDIVLRQSLSDFLQDSEFDVLTAENGRKGIEVFCKTSVDLVITDLRMPEIDGLGVISRIHAHDEDVPVIVVSGTGDIGEAVEAMRAGAWDYILKPVGEMEILLNSISKVTERAGLIKENREYQQNLEKLVEERTSSLKQALEEKNVLLKELNHRVKNNLQFLVSLASLQLQQDDEEDESQLEALYRRLKVFSEIHNSLYQYEEVTRIDLKEHLGKDFNDLVYKHTGKYTEDYKIELDIPEPFFDLNSAVPCGLILNELMTASIMSKGKTESRVYVHIMQDSEGHISRMIYQDDNNSFVSGSTEFGRLLIESMAAQLGLNAKIEKDGKARYIFINNRQR